MNNFLPSKKFILIISAIIIAILIIWLGQSLLKNKKSAFSELSETEKKQYTEFMAKDTDGDGLKDWEESLWKTNPNQADSDSDGTNDAEEIMANRNPNLANQAKNGGTPTDKVSQEIIDDQKKAEESFKNLTETEKLSRLILSQYLAVKESGVLDNTSKNYIISNSIASDLSTYSPPLDKNDIIITNNNSAIDLKTYLNNLTNALTYTGQKDLPQETSILATAIADENPKILNELDKNIAVYSQIIDKLKKISTPGVLANYHLAVINDFIKIKKDVGDMKFIFSDTLITVYALENYRNNVEKLNKDVNQIKNYILSQKIVFTKEDSGYILFNNVK